MKKFIYLFLSMFCILSLTACDDVSIPVDDYDLLLNEAISYIDINYADGDSSSHVTKNVQLIAGELNGITLSWTSSDEDVIAINQNVGEVIRKSEDKPVRLTATLQYLDIEKSKTFDLLVIKKDDNEAPVDDEALMIYGLNNYILNVGDEAPNYLDGVSAIDGNGNLVEVTYDDSNVDLSNAGQYDITYRVSLNDQSRSIDMKVIVVEASEGEAITETFDKLDTSSSSYVDGSFVGQSGITWTYSGARGDLELSGKAIGFGGKSADNSYISATIDGGITSLSFDYDKPFSNGQIYDVLIDGEVVGSFDNSNGSGHFNLDGLNVSGSFELIIKPQQAEDGRRQLTLDNISWKSFGSNNSNPDMKVLVEDFKELAMDVNYYLDQTLDLVHQGAHGSDITWKLLNGSSWNDISSYDVNVPDQGSSQVILKAVLTYGSTSIEKVFVISMGQPDIMPLGQVLTLDDGDYVYTKGIVTAYFESSDGMHAFIQSGNQAIEIILNDIDTSDIIEGNEIEVKGYISGHTIINIESISFINYQVIETLQVTSDELSQYVNQFVEVQGYLEQSYDTSSQTFVLKTMDGDITLSYPDIQINASISALLSNKMAGSKVVIDSIVYSYGNSYGLYLINADDMTVDEDVSLSELDQITLKYMDAIELPSQIQDSITLPDDSSLLFGSSIAWQSNQPDVLSNEGVLNLPSEDMQVVMTYTIYNKDHVAIDSKSFEINIVLSQSNYTGSYYDGINTNLSGDQFKAELSDLISDMHDRGYDAAKYILQDSDEDPNNARNIILVYNRASIVSTWNGTDWNREHIWPQSKLGTASKSDMFNLRPANNSINSRRSNYPFGDYRDSDSQGYGLYSGYWYPGDDDRGDIARAILYMNTRWGLNISSSVIGSLDTFLEWDKLDPVDDFEMHRNDIIENEQGNRNPYVDHPEWVSKVYGNSQNMKVSTEASLIYDIEYLHDTRLYQA